MDMFNVRIDGRNGYHARLTLFQDHKNCGQLVISDDPEVDELITAIQNIGKHQPETNQENNEKQT